MNKNEFEGKMGQMKGAIEREVGKATGDTGTQLKGTLNKAVGEVRESIGRKQADKD